MFSAVPGREEKCTLSSSFLPLSPRSLPRLRVCLRKATVIWCVRQRLPNCKEMNIIWLFHSFSSLFHPLCLTFCLSKGHRSLAHARMCAKCHCHSWVWRFLWLRLPSGLWRNALPGDRWRDWERERENNGTDVDKTDETEMHWWREWNSLSRSVSLVHTQSFITPFFPPYHHFQALKRHFKTLFGSF